MKKTKVTEIVHKPLAAQVIKLMQSQINNPKKNIQSMLKFSNVEWDDRCMKFYQNKRAIKTASDTQVRKKIYNTSIETWKNFESSLKSSFNKLPN